MESPFKGKRGLISLVGNGGKTRESEEDEVMSSMTSSVSAIVRPETPAGRSFVSRSWYEEGHSKSVSEFSAVESVITEAVLSMTKEKAECLFSLYCKTLQMRTNEMEVFEVIQQLHEVCENVLQQMEKSSVLGNDYGFSRTDKAASSLRASEWLEQEMKTWKLMRILYYDRRVIQSAEPNDDSLYGLGQISEKQIVSFLYSSNGNVREYQLVVDWLEESFKFKERPSLVSRFAGKNVGWENTLLQILGQKDIAFGNEGEMVKSLDLDASAREKRNLHPLDMEDDLLLSKCVFYDIRSGNLDDASVLLTNTGQPLKALLFQGWRLYDDPNNYSDENTTEKLPIEGNPQRDVWKRSSWSTCESNRDNEYHKAALGALCGHLGILKSISKTWEDLLWAYLKVQVDIRVETEIRSYVVKNFVPMPDEYWKQKLPLEKIFEEISLHPDANIRNYASSYMAIIQKYLILDDTTELLNQLCRWVEESHDSQNPQITAHHLRFFTHIILFLKQIVGIDNEEQADKVISSYVEVLIEKGDAHLIAFYCSVLRSDSHVKLYSKFLERIQETSARSNVLEEAINVGLNTELILKMTVENACRKEPSLKEMEKVQVGDISAFDKEKIKSLEWLTFLPSQKLELLWQSNGLIRLYLAESKTDCVKAVLNQVPSDCVNLLINEYGSKDNLPCRHRYAIKEHLNYKVYIAALDLFNEWFELNQNSPKGPNSSNDKNHFAEKVAMEHKENVYKQDFERWEKSFASVTTAAHDALYNILVFPDGGWLIDEECHLPSTGISLIELENRARQMQQIRSICIPEVVLLLHNILLTKKDYKGCFKLANEVASEERKLYRDFPRDKLSEFLHKLCLPSKQLLNAGLDPWGYPKTA